MVRAYPRPYQPKITLTNWMYEDCNFGASQSMAQPFSIGYTLIPRQTLNQTTDIIVVYAYEGLGVNKYQNIGWYRYTSGRTSKKYLSRTRRMGTVISVHHALRVSFVKRLYPHTQTTPQPNHYYHSHVSSYKSRSE